MSWWNRWKRPRTRRRWRKRGCGSKTSKMMWKSIGHLIRCGTPSIKRKTPTPWVAQYPNSIEILSIKLRRLRRDLVPVFASKSIKFKSRSITSPRFRTSTSKNNSHCCLKDRLSMPILTRWSAWNVFKKTLIEGSCRTSRIRKISLETCLSQTNRSAISSVSTTTRLSASETFPTSSLIKPLRSSHHPSSTRKLAAISDSRAVLRESVTELIALTLITQPVIDLRLPSWAPFQAAEARTRQLTWLMYKTTRSSVDRAVNWNRPANQLSANLMTYSKILANNKKDKSEKTNNWLAFDEN